jgi:thiol-disulfide isomerase/thioredoxin
MKRFAAFVAIALLGVASLSVTAPAAAAETEEPHLVLFWAEGCPYCEAEREFLADLAERMPALRVVQYEVSGSDVNRALWVEAMAGRGLAPEAVPTTIVGDRVWVGFDERRAIEIEAVVGALVAGEEAPEEQPSTVIDVPLFGGIDVGSHSLLVATLLIGFVDGFNPCSLWVLSMLLALVLHTGSRRRVLAVGAVFLAVTTAMYGFYIVGLYGVLSYVGYTTWIRVAVAAIAFTIGAINVKDYFAFGAGPSLTIPEKSKPGLLGKMRRIAAGERPLPPLLLSTGALAVGVSLLETPCTAGFPILWTDMLGDAGVGIAAAVALFAAYMAVFLIDELAVFTGAVVAMRVTKVGEQRGRFLKLMGGTVMIAMAGTLLMAPEAMENVGGVIAVFGIGALMAGFAIALSRLGVGRPGSRTPTSRREPM